MLLQTYFNSTTSTSTPHRLNHRSSSGSCLEALEPRRLLSFTPAVTYPAGVNPQGIATTDFNNDGNLDLIFTNGENIVSVLRGTAVGTFPPAQNSPADAYGRSTPSDVNGDGIPDFVGYDEGYRGDVWVEEMVTQINNGDGTFAPAVRHVINGYYRSYAEFLTFGDLNADRKMDAVVIIYEDTDGGLSPPVHVSVGLVLGRGDGTFLNWTAYKVGYGNDELIELHSPSLADFNRDGHIDIAVGETTYEPGEVIENVKILLGAGNGNFQSPRDYDLAGDIHSLGAGDVTNDGIPDLVTSATWALSVLPGRGDGTFATPIVYTPPAVSSRVDADFNGDGLLDRVLLEATTDSGGMASLLLGSADGTFHPAESFEVGPNPTAIATGDFNRDGRPDLAVIGAEHFPDEDLYIGRVSVLLNDGVWATKTFVGAGGAGSGGNWANANNWNPAAIPSASDRVAIAGKSVNLSSSATIASLTVSGGASLVLASNGNHVLQASTLLMSGNSSLNVNNNKLVLDYSGGSPTGTWNGTTYTGLTGLIQSQRIIGATSLGIAEIAGDVVIRATHPGDANLSGGIDGDDYFQIDSGYVSQAGGYANGDFDYNGRIDADDYFLIDSNYHKAQPPLGAASASDLPGTNVFASGVDDSAYRRLMKHDPAIVW